MDGDGSSWGSDLNRKWATLHAETVLDQPIVPKRGTEAPIATPDPVKRPTHYRIFDDLPKTVEAMDIIEAVVRHYPPDIGYHIGNLLKYAIRAPHKGALEQDLKK